VVAAGNQPSCLRVGSMRPRALVPAPYGQRLREGFMIRRSIMRRTLEVLLWFQAGGPLQLSRRWFARRAGFDELTELSKLTERELEDIGLTRADVLREVDKSFCRT
jgi:uncharacterized protein YjiS (DUF1127 family)